ncbi:MAG: aminoglycoside phosphotransferase family protein [Eubacteriales bacterium]|nr:aminoglycoside phosphotransferase family protein [Eubacteriales bacterium]MDD3073400.1 aminoglycoside phosphotransferase family protein [Eubacteriales bacterium]MDD4078659.1 aminoglycoside phosphotransferase family protein [Eubacteriales bacterium]MDD4769193.1 aminoglycoside phosphotransferase family protein [Eubacteriales bacterium]
MEREKLLRLATELIAQHTGQKRPVAGQPTNNWVFRTTDAEAPLLVKFIPADRKPRMETELTLSKYISSQAGVPIPRILGHGTIEDQHFLLREVIPGVTLRQALNENANPKPLFIQAGETLAQFHCFSFTAKGFFNPDLSIDKSADIFNQAEYESFLSVLQAKKQLSAKEYNVLRDIRVNDYYGISENVLCHCDYSPDNILVQNCRLVGVIDFEFCCSAPFMDDLAAFDLFASLNGYGKYLDCFYEGYSKFRPISDFYFSGLNFYKFYRLISMLSYQLGADRFHGPFLEQMKQELARTKPEFCA